MLGETKNLKKNCKNQYFIVILFGKLLIIQFFIITFLIYKLIVRTLLNDFAVVQNDDLIGIFSRRNPVTYNDGCFVFAEF